MKSVRNQLALLLVIIPMITISCKKDLTDTTDITAWEWKVKSVTTNGKTFKPKKKDYLRNDAYILVFENDMTFKLNTSVNMAGGNYLIVEKGKVSISTYEEYTEVVTTDNKEVELNKNLLTVFNEVTTYEVLGDILIFKGTKGEVKLKKE
jgi:hypothetical protein